MANLKCENCGRPLADKTEVVIIPRDEGGPRIFCVHCYPAFGTCQTCKHRDNCGFFQNPDSLPQFVMATKEERTPFGVTRQTRQMPNPARVRRFCIDNECKCFINDPEHPICCKHTDCKTCPNYDEIDI